MELETYTKLIRLVAADKFYRDAYLNTKLWRDSYIESKWIEKLFYKNYHFRKAALIIARAYFINKQFTTSVDYIELSNNEKKL